MALTFRSTPAHAILMMLAGWIHREQDVVVAYQREEIRALREMLGGKRLRFTDAQRRRLALKARLLSHAKLRELGSLVTPDTLTRGSANTRALSTIATPSASRGARRSLSTFGTSSSGWPKRTWAGATRESGT
jgi:hypothetical protein